MRFQSKLPDVGTTIFTVMSRRASMKARSTSVKDSRTIRSMRGSRQALLEAVAEGHNQYAPMEGVAALREHIARKLKASYAIEVDPITEITITCGGTEALYDAIQAVIGPGDEAIIFDPAYDAYEPAVRLAGGRCVRVPLAPPLFSFDWDRVRAHLSTRTRLVIMNSPQNPSCTVATRADLDALAALVRDRPISILADEVYENVLFDGRRHASVLAHPGIARAQLRGVLVRQGVARHGLAHRLLRCAARPDRASCARCINSTPSASSRRCSMRSRATWRSAPTPGPGSRRSSRRSATCSPGSLRGSGFEPLTAAGTYFLLVDYGALSRTSDVDFADRLIREAKVATIPLSPFYAAPPPMTCCACASPSATRLCGRLLSGYARSAPRR